MQKKRSWRDILAQVFEDSYERQRIAQELEVHPMTLKRWVKKEVTPRLQNLYGLINALPQHREALIQHFQAEFPDFIPPTNSKHPGGSDQLSISLALYENVLQIHAHTPYKIRSNLICETIISDALKLLDPDQSGMSITVSGSMPFHGGIIRSIRELIGRGTPPWSTMGEHNASLLGTESLTGHAIIKGHIVSNPDLDNKQNLSAGYGAKWEKSAVAVPIMRGSLVAGSVTFASTEVHYFTPERRNPIQHYANLLALAFEHDQFYPQEKFQLGQMPKSDAQREQFKDFKKRINQIMRTAHPDQLPVTYAKAELIAWQEMEDRLLELGSRETFDS